MRLATSPVAVPGLQLAGTCGDIIVIFKCAAMVEMTQDAEPMAAWMVI